MRRRKASLTGKLFFTMIGIVAGTVILCWFFNNTFLERFYIYNKQTELYKGYQLVNEAWNNHTLENGAFDVTFESSEHHLTWKVMRRSSLVTALSSSFAM